MPLPPRKAAHVRLAYSSERHAVYSRLLFGTSDDAKKTHPSGSPRRMALGCGNISGWLTAERDGSPEGISMTSTISSTPPATEPATSRRPGAIDAIIGFALVLGGNELITRALIPFASSHNLLWLPDYAAHVWILLVPLFWLMVLNRRFPIGRLIDRRMTSWLLPWFIAAVLALIAGLIFASIGQPVAIGGDVKPDALTVFMLLLFQGFFVAVSEEFAFRGLIQTGLAETIPGRLRLGSRSIGMATILAAVLFGLFHAPALTRQSLVVTEAEVLIGFVAGIVSGYVYEKTDNLWGAVIFHGAYNLLFAIPLLTTLH